MILGRMTFCWNCGNIFKMSHSSLQEDLPMCPSCRVNDDDLLEVLNSSPGQDGILDKINKINKKGEE